jgi:hypothetical protein
MRLEESTIDILVLARLITEEIHVAWPWKPPSLLLRAMLKSAACRLQDDDLGKDLTLMVVVKVVFRGLKRRRYLLRR